jgi:hypothetical protein
MADAFDLANIADAIQGYRTAKKKSDIIGMEKKQREAEMMMRSLQEQRLREQMLGGQQLGQQELGLRTRRFEEVEKPTAQSIADLRAQTAELTKQQAANQAVLASIAQRLEDPTVASQQAVLGARGATAEETMQQIEGRKPYIGGAAIAETKQRWAEADLATRRAKGARQLLPEQIEAQRKQLQERWAEADLATRRAKGARQLLPVEQQVQQQTLQLQQQENVILQKYIDEHGETPELTKLGQDLAESRARVQNLVSVGKHQEALTEATKATTAFEKELRPLQIIAMKREYNLDKLKANLTEAQIDSIYGQLALQEQRLHQEWVIATGRATTDPLQDDNFRAGLDFMRESIELGAEGDRENAEARAQEAISFFKSAGMDIKLGPFGKKPTRILGVLPWPDPESVPRFLIGSEAQLQDQIDRGRDTTLTPRTEVTEGANKNERLAQIHYDNLRQVGLSDEAIRPIIDADDTLPSEVRTAIIRLLEGRSK